MTNAIQLNHVSFLYDKNDVIKDFNCEIPYGSFWVIKGASGCGKSTWLKLIAGLLKPKSGNCTIDPHASMALLFQDQALWPHLDVFKHIDLVLKSVIKNKSQRKEKVMELLNDLHIEHLKNSLPEDLSGGERQRLALARALATNAQILLLDEPFNHLDQKTASLVSQLITNQNDLNNKIVLMITHSDIDIKPPHYKEYQFTPSKLIPC